MQLNASRANENDRDIYIVKIPPPQEIRSHSSLSLPQQEEQKKRP
jgi:hypothetical protein